VIYENNTYSRIVNKCVNNYERKRLLGFSKFKEVFLKKKDLEIVLCY